MAEIKVPARSEVHDMEDGRKEIRIYINGRATFGYIYDPRVNTLSEQSRSELETKGWYHHG